MGFIKRNKYTFEIYLTDKGREALLIEVLKTL